MRTADTGRGSAGQLRKHNVSGRIDGSFTGTAENRLFAQWHFYVEKMRNFLCSNVNDRGDGCGGSSDKD